MTLRCANACTIGTSMPLQHMCLRQVSSHCFRVLCVHGSQMQNLRLFNALFCCGYNETAAR